MKNIFTTTLIAIITLAFAGCNTGDEPTPTKEPSFDFATLTYNSTDGSMFTLRQGEDTPLITYKSSYQFPSDSQVKVGDRLIIAYYPDGGTPYVSGNIDLQGYRALESTNQDLLIDTQSSTSNWFSYPISPIAISRTGEYINVQATLYSATGKAPKKFVLVADEATLDLEQPELHIIFVPETEGGNSYTGYASFNIDEVWSRDTCKGVRIECQTPTGIKQYTYKKTEEMHPIE